MLYLLHEAPPEEQNFSMVMREDLKAVERLRKTAEQLSRQERDKSHDRGPER